MAAEIIKAIAEFLKLAPRYLTVVGVIAGVLVFAPSEFLDKLGVAEFAENHRQWIGLAFLFSATVVLVDWCKEIVAAIRNRSHRAKLKEECLKRLHSLTEDEEDILRHYTSNQTRTSVLGLDDGVAQGLVSVGILYPAARQGHLRKGLAHNITEFAWEYLNENKALVEASTPTFRRR